MITTQMLFVLVSICGIGLLISATSNKSSLAVGFIVAGAFLGIQLILRLL